MPKVKCKSFTVIKEAIEFEDRMLIIDVETTGLPKQIPGGWNLERYYPYEKNEAYDSSRLIQVAWKVTVGRKKYKIHSHMVKSDGFKIPPAATKVHHITDEMLEEHGEDTADFIDELTKAMEKADWIVGHNVFFDIAILLNHFHRTGHKKALDVLGKMVYDKKILCFGEATKDLTKLTLSSGKYKMPRLKEVYQHVYGKEPDNEHRADGDVNNLVDCMLKISDMVL